MRLRRRERESLGVVEEGGGEEKVRRDGDRKGLRRREIICGRCRDDIADWRQLSIGLGIVSD